MIITDTGFFVVLAEEIKEKKFLTTDFRDFTVYSISILYVNSNTAFQAVTSKMLVLQCSQFICKRYSLCHSSDYHN